MEVLSTFQVSNSENVSENLLTIAQLSGKSAVPLKESAVVSEQTEAEQDDVEEDEEDVDDDDEEEEEEQEDENADALPEGCLAPEQEALEASIYATELGLSEGQEVLEYVGQASWDRYDKVVDSYWKIVESEVRETKFDQCAQEALQMNKRVDEVVMKIAKEVLPVTPCSSAVVACRDAFFLFVEKAIHKAYLFTENRGDFTISTTDLEEAFRLMNKKLPSDVSQGLFTEMNEYDSAEDEDYVEDEQMEEEDPLEWDSEAESEDEMEDVEEEDTEYGIDIELMNDVINHYIDLITPSDDPEEAEAEGQEPEVNEVDVEVSGVELLQRMAHDFIKNIFSSANKSSQHESVGSPAKALKKPLSNKDIKFVLDVCPQLHL